MIRGNMTLTGRTRHRLSGFLGRKHALQVEEAQILIGENGVAYRLQQWRDVSLSDDITVLPEVPEGWFLHRAAHEHTAITHMGDEHTPLPHRDGPWIVEFQKLPSGGHLTQGRGHTIVSAWQAAVEKVEQRRGHA